MDSTAGYNVLADGCPSREIMQRLGDKWSPLVLLTLAGGPQRFSTLREAIGTVTPKVLTSTLRTLERDGLVARTVTAQVPVRVDYELTALGRSLGEPLEVLRRWSEQHVPQILSARRAYDEAGSTNREKQ